MMKQQRFTARELVVMAYMSRKPYLYGIEDDFSDVPQQERPAVLETTYNALAEKDIIRLGFDGEFRLHSDYADMLRFCCDCDQCLVINTHDAANRKTDYVFWRLNDEYLMAEAEGNQFVFSAVNENAVRNYVSAGIKMQTVSDGDAQVIVPYTALHKAKQAMQTGDRKQACRLIRQNGVDAQMADVIADGLSDRGNYIGLLYQDNRGDERSKEELAFLCSRGMMLRLGETIVNLRSCAVFSKTDVSQAKQSITRILDLLCAAR